MRCDAFGRERRRLASDFGLARRQDAGVGPGGDGKENRGDTGP